MFITKEVCSVSFRDPFHATTDFYVIMMSFPVITIHQFFFSFNKKLVSTTTYTQHIMSYQDTFFIINICIYINISTLGFGNNLPI